MSTIRPIDIASPPYRPTPTLRLAGALLAALLAAATALRLFDEAVVARVAGHLTVDRAALVALGVATAVAVVTVLLLRLPPVAALPVLALLALFSFAAPGDLNGSPSGSTQVTTSVLPGQVQENILRALQRLVDRAAVQVAASTQQVAALGSKASTRLPSVERR